MELEYQEEIDRIENCPAIHEKGEKKLYRWVENPVTENSFLPVSKLRAKQQKNCIAWGLSVFDSLEAAKQVWKSVAKNKRVNYATVAECIIKDEDGIKHCGNNKRHYTFFPKKGLDLVHKFSIVEENEK